MLYSRYSNPMEFMRLYIDQGRFGEFTAEVFDAEKKRREELDEQRTDDRLWAAYIHSYSDKSFADWKSELLQPVRGRSAGKRDEDMTKDDIDRLLKRLFPPKPQGHSATM